MKAMTSFWGKTCFVSLLLTGVSTVSTASPLYLHQSDLTSGQFTQSMASLDDKAANGANGGGRMTTDPSFDPACMFPTDPNFDWSCATNPIHDPGCGGGTTDPIYDPYCGTSTDPFYDPNCNGSTDPVYDPYCYPTDPVFDPGCGTTNPSYNPECQTNPTYDNNCVTDPVYDPDCVMPTDPSFDWSCMTNPMFDPSCEVVAANEMPAGYGLLKIAPNPFNPVTTLSFKLPEASQVTLAVYDMQGRQVEMIHSGLAARGLNSISWDASRYASGIYLAILQANGLVQTEKLVLMK